MRGAARVAARLAVRPGTVADYVRMRRAVHGRSAPDPPPPAAARDPLALDAALERVRDEVGPWGEGPALTRTRGFEAPPPPDAGAKVIMETLAGDPALGELCYAIARAARPSLVVETGVATGVTSAYLLAALADAGTGELHSIDLPPLPLEAHRLVGCEIPPELRSRWTYHWGTSRRLLGRVLRGAGRPLDMFVHDSLHSYDNVRWELETAWAALAPGGWLVADDAGHHAAVQDVAEAVGADARYVRQRGKDGVTGLIRKASS